MVRNTIQTVLVYTPGQPLGYARPPNPPAGNASQDDSIISGPDIQWEHRHSSEDEGGCSVGAFESWAAAGSSNPSGGRTRGPPESLGQSAVEGRQDDGVNTVVMRQIVGVVDMYVHSFFPLGWTPSFVFVKGAHHRPVRTHQDVARSSLGSLSSTKSTG